jgi:hypothetical protein
VPWKRILPALAALAVIAVIAVIAVPRLAHRDAALPFAQLPSRRPVAVKPPKLVSWPLLGTLAPSASAIQRRVIVVKIDNERGAHPQTNVSAADVVYETPTEGGISRYAAIYHSQMPREVGPVRSARLSDVFIVPQFRGILARVGADYVVEGTMRDNKTEDMNQFINPGPYSRRGPHAAPHNMYVDLPALLKAAAKRGFASAKQPPRLAFGGLPKSPSSSGVAMAAAYSPAERFRWTWQSGAKLYAREHNGSSEGDEGSSKPYQAANVVVILAKARFGRALDPAGNPTLDVDLTGTGRAILFRDGRRFEGTWSASKIDLPTLKGSDGKPLTLSPGRTWFEVLPVGTAVESR